MARKKQKQDVAPASPAQTRSRSKKTAVEGNSNDAVQYTRVKSPKGDIQVVSKRKFKDDPDNHAKLRQRFDKIDGGKRDDEDGDGGISTTVSIVTNVNVFLYAACFFIQTGTLPYLTKKLGADPSTFGQLQTAFAVAQLLGGPVYGRLGDLMGERLALAVAFGAATASYVVMGVAESVEMLFLSRLPSVLMHVMQGSQMIMTSNSGESNRAATLSRLGFSYGIGMVVGPSLGGQVNKYFGEQAAALVAAGGSFLSLILVLIFIPNFSKEERRGDRGASSASVFNVSEILKAGRAPGVGGLLLVKLVCGVPIGVLQSMFSVIAMDRFALPPEENGFLMSYIGAISLAMQGVGIDFFTKLLTDRNIMNGSAVVLVISYYTLTLISGIQGFIVLLMPLTCSLCLVNSVLTASITMKKDKSEDDGDEEKNTGTLLGLNMAVHSAIRTAAPTVGGHMVSNHGFESIGYLGVACNLAVLLLLPRTALVANSKRRQ